MAESGGAPVVVTDEIIVRARELAGDPVSATGAAGLAGVLALRETGVLGDAETAAVLFTGATPRGAARASGPTAYP
jgi:hypothetical protein